jgi:hypothetical protein
MAERVLSQTALLRQSLYWTIVGHTEMQILREEYLDRPIADPGAGTIPPAQGVWTESEEDYYQRFLGFTKRLLSYGDEAGSGSRPVALDMRKNEIVIIGRPGEPSLSITPNGDMSISDLPPDEQAVVPSVYGSVGIDPLTFGILMAMAFIGTYVITDRVCSTIDQRTDYAKKTDLTTLHQRVLEKTGDVDKANEAVASVSASVAEQAKAKAELELAKEKPFDALADIAKGAAYAAITVGGIYLGGRLLLEVLPYFLRPKQELVVKTESGRRLSRA